MFLPIGCRNSKAFFVHFGGDKGIRTPDLLHAKQALYQLSYTPKIEQFILNMIDYTK